jgi:hypothetical protein
MYEFLYVGRTNRTYIATEGLNVSISEKTKARVRTFSLIKLEKN